MESTQVFEVEIDNTKLIIDIKQIRSIMESYYSKITTKYYSESDDTDIASFNVIMTDIQTTIFLTSLMPKDLANMVAHYNAKVVKYRIFVQTNLFSDNSKRWLHLSNYTTKHQYEIDTSTVGIFECDIYESLNINFFKITNDPITPKQMTCLQYIIDNKMHNSFINMEYTQLFTECTKVSRNVFNMTDYPAFYILMYNIISKKQLCNAVISSVVYGIIKNTFSKN